MPKDVFSSKSGGKAFDDMWEALCQKFGEELESWEEQFYNEDQNKYDILQEINIKMFENSPSFNAFALMLFNNGYTAERIEKEGVLENGFFKTGLERLSKEQSIKTPDSKHSAVINEITDSGKYKSKAPSTEYTVGDYMLDLYDMIEEDLRSLTDPTNPHYKNPDKKPDGPEYKNEYANINHDMIMLSILKAPHLAECAKNTFQPEMTHESVRTSYVTTPIEGISTLNSIFARSLNRTARDISEKPWNFGEYTQREAEKNYQALVSLTKHELKTFHENRVAADMEAKKKTEKKIRSELKEAISDLVYDELKRITDNEEETRSEDYKEEYDDINPDNVAENLLDGYLNKFTDIYFDRGYTAERMKSEGVRKNGVFANIVGEMAVTYLMDNPKGSDVSQYTALLTAAMDTGTLSKNYVEEKQQSITTDRKLEEADRIKLAERESINQIGGELDKMKDAKKLFGSNSPEFTCMTNALRDLKTAHFQNAPQEVKSALLELAYAKCSQYAATHQDPSSGYGKARLDACKSAMEQMRAIDSTLDAKMKERVTGHAASMEVANVITEMMERKNPKMFSSDAERITYTTKLVQSDEIKIAGSGLTMIAGTLQSLAERFVPTKGRADLTKNVIETLKDMAPAKTAPKKPQQEGPKMEEVKGVATIAESEGQTFIAVDNDGPYAGYLKKMVEHSMALTGDAKLAVSAVHLIEKVSKAKADKVPLVNDSAFRKDLANAILLTDFNLPGSPFANITKENYGECIDYIASNERVEYEARIIAETPRRLDHCLHNAGIAIFKSVKEFSNKVSEQAKTENVKTENVKTENVKTGVKPTIAGPSI